VLPTHLAVAAAQLVVREAGGHAAASGQISGMV
jgi:hypothetical protein